MKRTICSWVAVASLVVFSGAGFSGCSGGERTGSVEVVARALSSEDVAAVVVTVSADDIATPMLADLVKSGTQWKGTLGQIPVGANRTFTAEAFDASGNKIYSGQATGVEIIKHQVAMVLILLQQSTPPNPFANSAPRIASVVANGSSVEAAKPITFTAAVTDPDGDALSYAWAVLPDDGSSFSNGTSANTTWTSAANAAGTYTISVTVTDGKGGTATAPVQVQVHKGKGAAEITTAYNNWPVVTGVTAASGLLDVNASTTVTVTASDADGDSLSYLWNDGSCGGVLASPSAPSTTWTAPSSVPAGGSCTLTVEVSDGRGGRTTGSLTINVGPIVTNTPPIIDSSFQSLSTVNPGDVVTFRVRAHDPEGQAITFNWSVSQGSLGTPTSTADTSAVTWTAPAATGPFLVRCTVGDGLGETTYAFEGCVGLNALTCPPRFKTSWGRLGAADGEFDGIRSIAIDAQGFVYVSDCNNNRIQKFDPNGSFVTKWTVDGPFHVSVGPDGAVWTVGPVTQSLKSINRYSTSGAFLSLFSQMDDHRTLAFDVASNVYAVDHHRGYVRKFDSAGALLTTWNTGAFPVGIGIVGQELFLSLNRGDGPIQKFSLSGTPLGTLDVPGGFSLAVDASGYLYAAHAANKKIIKFSSTGEILWRLGEPGSGPGQFNDPFAVAVAANGDIYVGEGETGNSRIQVFSQQ